MTPQLTNASEADAVEVNVLVTYVFGSLAEYWPEPVDWELEPDGMRPVYEWAITNGEVLSLQCPKCMTRFGVGTNPHGPGYMCACPDCLGEASAATDGAPAAVGYGADPFMAAAAWQEENL